MPRPSRRPLVCLLARPALLLAAAAASAGSAAAQFGTNLVTNSGAEAGPGGSGSGGVPIPGWTTSGDFAVIAYTTGAGYPTAASPGPAVRGANFFGGGVGASASAMQTLSFSPFAELGALVDGGGVRYSLAAWLGGFASQGDNMTFTVDFLNGASATIGSVSVGPVTTADRGSITGLLLRNANGFVPAGTRGVTFTMLSTRLQGSANDGYADNLSFVLSGAPQSVVPEPSTWALLAAGLAGLAGVARRRARTA